MGPQARVTRLAAQLADDQPAAVTQVAPPAAAGSLNGAQKQVGPSGFHPGRADGVVSPGRLSECRGAWLIQTARRLPFVVGCGSAALVGFRDAWSASLARHLVRGCTATMPFSVVCLLGLSFDVARHNVL